MAKTKIRKEFDIGRAEASKILSEWMKWVESNPENRDA